MVNIRLDGRFLAVNVTPNPCPRRDCLMSVTMLKLMTIAENSDGSNASYSVRLLILIDKHFANEGF